MQLTMLMNELAEERRENPTDDLTSALVHNDLGEDMLAPERDRAVLHPPRGGRQRHHPHRHQPRHAPAAPEPRPARDLAGRPRRASPPPRSRRSCGSPRRSRSCAAPSPATLTLSGHDFAEGDKLILFYGAANRDPRGVRRPRALRRAPRPEPARRLRRPRPALLPRRPPRPARGRRWCSASCSPACPTSRWPASPYLEAMGIPLVGGIKHLPVRFTPTAPVGA